jgi:hypothetical protein
LQQAYPGIDITGTLGEANSSVASTEHQPAGLGQGNPITVTQTDTGQHDRGLAGGAPQQPADHSLLSGNGSELIAMGLGIMSGTSPFALTNIGQGALKGMEWSEAQRMRQATMELRAQQELWNRQHQAAMEQNTANRNEIYGQVSQARATQLQAAAEHLTALSIANGNKETFTPYGEDGRGNAIMMGNRGTVQTVPLPSGTVGFKQQGADTAAGRLTVQQQNADTASGRLTLAQQTAQMNEADKTYTRQQKANAMDVQAARSIMAAAAQVGKTVSYKQALDEAMSGNRALPEAGGSTPAATNMPSPKTEAEYNALPAGTQFMAPDGSVRIHP